MLFDQGQLEKMTLRAYLPQKKDDEAPQLSKAPKDAYVVQINPNSYTLSHLLRYTDRRGQGDSASDAVYAGSEPVEMTFEFVFDGTGIVPPPSPLGDVPLLGALESLVGGDEEFDVLTEIEKLNRVIYAYDGEQHRPRKLFLVWGPLELSCALKSIDYTFTLFKPDGSPLRAKAKATFRESLSDAERVRRDAASSPDLTHLHRVDAGDTLPLMAHQVYGDAGLYLELARVNKLVSFRRLREGRRISLPPVDKSGKGRKVGDAAGAGGAA